MNILLPDSWLRQYIKTDLTPQKLKEYLSLCGPSIEKITKAGDDYVYEIEITSNRVDMASVVGIAREARAILPRFNAEITYTAPNIPTRIEESERLPLIIKDDNRLCRRVLGIVMDNVHIGLSPKYISDRLEKSGVRSLNNLIDITNYVMLELGHPCHVFDYDRIKTNSLIIRQAKKGERLITLDGKACLLIPEDIIIDDGTGRIIDLPGIMGTQNSVVTPDTKRIVFFIESNDPVKIRRTSMRLGVRTMAATINEKQPDPELAKQALLYGIKMYQEVCQAKVASRLIDFYQAPAKPQEIAVTGKFINDRLGADLPIEEMVKILKSLEFTVTTQQDLLKVIPPTFRQFEVNIKEDIVEEVARIYGYHNLPSRLMTGEIPVVTPPKIFAFEKKIKDALKYWGYTEIYNYSFISKALLDKAGLDDNIALQIANPLTLDTVFMRPSLIPSLLNTMSLNQFYTDNLSLFEMANVYQPVKGSLPIEKMTLAITNQQSFYHLKGIVEALLSDLGINGYKIQIGISSGIWQSNQTVEYLLEGKSLAVIGKIKTEISNNFGLKRDTFTGQLDIEVISSLAKSGKQYMPIPIYQPIIEDYSFIIPDNIYIKQIIDKINNLDKIISGVILYDSFENSRTLRVTYQSKDKNLSADDIKPVRQKIVDTLEDEFKIKLKE